MWNTPLSSPASSPPMPQPQSRRVTEHQLSRATHFLAVSLVKFAPEETSIVVPGFRQTTIPHLLALAESGEGSAIFQGLADVYRRLDSIDQAVREQERLAGIVREKNG
ncbi:MAG TPA: hypothetical protein PLI01_02265 [Nitrospira sp.]|nr:hypothetical protein [Nitrospira sp.]MCW5778832.1 hypothetical protein [Nitrospira sp.]HNA25589.1 hypothetical protein [Nitrospira sp.]